MCVRGSRVALRKVYCYILSSFTAFFIVWFATSHPYGITTCVLMTCQRVPSGAHRNRVPHLSHLVVHNKHIAANTSAQESVNKYQDKTETIKIEIIDPGTETFYKNVKERYFVETENKRVFIFGAVVRNSSRSAAWDTLNIYGQWHETENLKNAMIRCCLKSNGSYILETPVKQFGRTWHNNKELPLQPWYVTCDTPGSSFKSLRWTSIVRGRNACADKDTRYIAPYFAMRRKPGHLVITTKTAHENLNPKKLIAQLESFRYLQVDKVMAYVEDTLWDKAKKVLGHYASIGFLDIFTYKLADVERYPRKISEQSEQILADQITVMRDAAERNSGSTYFSIMDNDEIPTPPGNRTLKSALKILGEKYPMASSFVLKNQHFFTDVMDTTCSEKCTLFNQFQYTVPDKFNLIHRKVISYPSRILIGNLYSHHAKPMDGYYEVLCPESELFLRHYGLCERKFSQEVCSSRRNWVYNTSAATWADKTLTDNIISTLTLVN